MRSGPRVSLLTASRAPLLVVVLGVLAFSIGWSAAAPSLWSGAPVARAAERALADGDLQNRLADPAARPAAIREVKELNTRWVRLSVLWSSLESTKGTYDPAQVADLDAATDALDAAGIKVLLSINYPPPWAQDRSFTVPEGGSYPMRDGALDDFGRLGEFLASHFSGRVRAIECWNEPNLWLFLYPQRTANDPYFAARLYLRMLKSFHAGVHRGDPKVLVVGGGTAPVGADDRYRTSPQRFAGFLKANGAAAYFDVYSHHPYVPGGTINPAPDDLPNDPSTTVTLRNLPTLLRLFPTKPFYLTEYAYNTRYSLQFGLTVTPQQQATYLRQAYTYVQRFPQVKMLVWYLVRDTPPPPGRGPEYGLYTGLREANGARKLSWFAFAGGNRLTVAAPSRVRRGRAARVSGTLTNSSLGAVAGRRLILQSRRLSSRSWRTLRSATTNDLGRYTFWPKPTSSSAYRVVWRGVKTSPSVTVRVY